MTENQDRLAREAALLRRPVTTPEHVSAIAEIVAGRLDVDGFDADAPVAVKDLTARTIIRAPGGQLFELTLKSITQTEADEFAATEGWLR